MWTGTIITKIPSVSCVRGKNASDPFGRYTYFIFICSLYESQHAFRAALCDSFNTPAAIGVLRDLITRTNVYVTARGKALNVQLLENVAHWTGQMLRMFGLGAGPTEELGWGQDDAAASGGVNVRLISSRSYLSVLTKSIVIGR